MKKMDRGVQLLTADSKQWEVTKNNYLPGGLLNVIGSKCASVINAKKITIGRMGNWIAFSMEHVGKRLEIINLCRMPVSSSSSNGVHSSLVQHNLIDGEGKSANDHRKEMFREIKQHVNNNKETNDIIIAGDYDQNAFDNEVKNS